MLVFLYNHIMKKSLTFEEAMSELDDIISVLEKGDCPLDKAIEYYTKGSELRKFCEKKLNDAREKIEKIDQKHINEKVSESYDTQKILEFEIK